jgi:hypothetical protein
VVYAFYASSDLEQRSRAGGEGGPVPYSWAGAIFQILAVTIIMWWFRVTPPSGFAVAALAIAATIMAVRALRFTKVEEVVWILIAFAFFGIEIRAIQKDRADFANAETARRAEENAQFQGIVNGLTAAIEKSQKQFDATMRELAINQSTLTGAHSACYMSAINLVSAQRYLAFVHIGEFPLYGVNARITTLGRDGKWIPENPQEVTVSVGDMIKGHANLRNVPNGLVTSPDYFNSNIFFTARNGDWIELLREQKVDGELRVAIRVKGRFTSLAKEQTICETIDPKFPRKPNGDIDDDFKSEPKAPRCQ